jgi:hypothetical protein
MPTEKQISANKVNAQKSTGPNTTAGKEASARNALKHGLSAKKYLTSSETPEEFAPLYAARRRLYPPNDPIIDRLVEKITLAHFRIDRGFEAEADILDQGTLAEMLVHDEKPVKYLGAYEASNRKTLRMLEEELARYLSMLRESGDLESMSAEPPVNPPGDREIATAHPPANDTAVPSTPAAEQRSKDQKQNGKPTTVKSNEPASPSAGPVATSPAETASTTQNQKTKPISTGGSTPASDAISSTGAAATPPAP